MNVVPGMDVSKVKSGEWKALNTSWNQLSNRWSIYLYIMLDNSLMITIEQETKIPMKLIKLTVGLNESNVKMYENLEFIPYKSFGISFPRVDYIKSLKFHMETDVQDYKSITLTKEEMKSYLDNFNWIYCLDSENVLNVNNFNSYKPPTITREERRIRGIKKRVAEGFIPWSEHYRKLCC